MHEIKISLADNIFRGPDMVGNKSERLFHMVSGSGARVNGVHHIGSDLQQISIHQAGVYSYIDSLYYLDDRRALHVRRGASV
jgi:hypothetical protein